VQLLFFHGLTPADLSGVTVRNRSGHAMAWRLRALCFRAGLHAVRRLVMRCVRLVALSGAIEYQKATGYNTTRFSVHNHPFRCGVEGDE
jgi:hypothetical protein